MSTQTGLPELARAAGDVVITPDGGGGTWQIDAHGSDATFVDAVVDKVAQSTCVDLNRVGAAGFSAGAAFAILYSCARPSMIAVVATVAVDFQLGCTKPMSILAFHGTKDPAVPFQDGAIGLSLPGVKVRGTELNLGDWARLDGCQPPPETRSIGTEVTRQSWAGCQSDTEVVLYRIEGGGHTWPGADPASGIGLTTQQVSATNQIVAFLARHRLV